MSLAHLLRHSSPPNTTRQLCHIAHDADTLARGPVHNLEASDAADYSATLATQKCTKHGMLT